MRRLSISAMAASICFLRNGCAVAAACRVSSARASFNDSCPHLVRIGDRRLTAAAAAIRFALFHPLLDARLRVDQAFSRISHDPRIQDGRRKKEAGRPGEIDPQQCESTRENGKRGEARRRIAPLPSGGRGLVPRLVRRPDAAAEGRLAGDCRRRLHADPRAHRQRQDADRLSLGHQSGHVSPLAPRETRATADTPRLAPRETRATVDTSRLAPRETRATADTSSLAPRETRATVDTSPLAPTETRAARILYISPLKALPWTPSAISAADGRHRHRAHAAAIGSTAEWRCGRGYAGGRAGALQREPADILITPPERTAASRPTRARRCGRSAP